MTFASNFSLRQIQGYVGRVALAASLSILTVAIPAVASPTQDCDEFRSLIIGFAVALPEKVTVYKPGRMEIAKYVFPVNFYRWESPDDNVDIIIGEGTNNLEYPEYTKLFLSSHRELFREVREKLNGRLIQEEPWAVDGHPGWRLVEEFPRGAREVRVFLIGRRFYMVNLTVAGRNFTERHKRILDSFRRLTREDMKAEQERLIDWATPPPFPQETPTDRPRPDAEEQNLRDSVQRVYTDEVAFFDPIKSSSRQLVSRQEFDREGYLLTEIQFSGIFPSIVTRYGYRNGSRVFRRADGFDIFKPPPCAESSLTQRKPRNQLYTMSYKHDKNGKLEELRISSDDGVTERYAYEKNQQRLQTQFSRGSGGRKSLVQWKSEVELDAEGNAVSEKKTQYYETRDDVYPRFAEQVNVHDVISQSTKGPVLSTTGNPYPPPLSVRDVAKNPNRTVRTTETRAVTKEGNSSHYEYTYEYDSHHNWIKRTTYVVTEIGRAPIKETYRTIVYYQ